MEPWKDCRSRTFPKIEGCSPSNESLLIAKSCWRLDALGDAVEHASDMKLGLIRPGEGDATEIHDAVISALAQAPFRKNGQLDQRAFIALVKSEFEKIEAAGGVKALHTDAPNKKSAD
jgi:hypothetical protein